MIEPPSSPLAEPPLDPRVLTHAERVEVERIRTHRTWYDDADARDHVTYLLRLVERLTADTEEL